MVKLHLKARIGRIAYKYNTLIEDLVSKNNLEIFFSKFRKKYISCDLIRIGSPGDGGYLMPNILNEVSYCFSPGVDNIADFEKELSEKYNITYFDSLEEIIKLSDIISLNLPLNSDSNRKEKNKRRDSVKFQFSSLTDDKVLESLFQEEAKEKSNSSHKRQKNVSENLEECDVHTFGGSCEEVFRLLNGRM
jgi:hypothetical protein